MKKIIFLLSFSTIALIKLKAHSFSFLKKKESKNSNVSKAKYKDTVKIAPVNSKVKYIRPNFVKAAKIGTEAVVHIKAIQKVKNISSPRFRSEIDKFLFEFFGKNFENIKSRPRVGFGSGVILTNDGYIVTNNHVINGATTIEVTLHNNEKYNAKVIGQDNSTDLAILKINKNNLPYLKIGNSDDIEVGEWILTVGNPMGLNSTVTAGIISAKNRSRSDLSSTNKLEIGSFIQIDAAINMGNSGGALIDLNGNLIGINTAIISQTGTFIGMGFAIPSKIVLKVFNDIVKFGIVQKGILHIKGVNVTLGREMVATNKVVEGINLRSLKNALSKFKSNSGAIIIDVKKNKAAYNAGLRSYDIIVGINNKPINTISRLQEILISEHKPGDKIIINFYRNGIKKETLLTLETDKKYLVTNVNNIYQTNNIQGAHFTNLTEYELKKYKIGGGVKLKKLNEGIWKKKGIKENFIITNIIVLNSDKHNIFIKDVNILCNTLNEINDTTIVIKGFYPYTPSKKEVHAFHWN